MRAVLLMIVSVLFHGCVNDNCRDSIDPVTIDIQVYRFEEQLFKASSEKEIEKFLVENKRFASLFLNADQYPGDSVLASIIFNLFQNKAIDTLYQEAIEAFKNFEEIEEEIETGLGRLTSLYPQVEVPKMQTTISGLAEGADLLITNKEIIIGLDFFIGEEATFKPMRIPNYILNRYDTEHLPSIVLKFISSQFVTPGKGDALLVEMIDHGKSLFLTSLIMPCTPENIIMGYTEEEWHDVFSNDEIIWANFIQNKWLYETDHNIKQKFIGERPNVYEIGDKCPGRIGVWLGWQIVKKYVEQNEISPTDLMKETDHNKIFAKSKYKPGQS